MLLSKYAKCGSKKSRFIKNQEAKGLLSILGTRTPLSKVPILGVIANMKKCLQSDWARGVQYWPYLYYIFNICTLLQNNNKKSTFDFRSRKIEIYLLKTN